MSFICIQCLALSRLVEHSVIYKGPKVWIESSYPFSCAVSLGSTDVTRLSLSLSSIIFGYMPVSFPDLPPGLKRGLGTRLHACMNNQRTIPPTKYIKLVYSPSFIRTSFYFPARTVICHLWPALVNVAVLDLISFISSLGHAHCLITSSVPICIPYWK